MAKMIDWRAASVLLALSVAGCGAQPVAKKAHPQGTGTVPAAHTNPSSHTPRPVAPPHQSGTGKPSSAPTPTHIATPPSAPQQPTVTSATYRYLTDSNTWSAVSISPPTGASNLNPAMILAIDPVGPAYSNTTLTLQIRIDNNFGTNAAEQWGSKPIANLQGSNLGLEVVPWLPTFPRPPYPVPPLVKIGLSPFADTLPPFSAMSTEVPVPPLSPGYYVGALTGKVTGSSQGNKNVWNGQGQWQADVNLGNPSWFLVSDGNPPTTAGTISLPAQGAIVGLTMSSTPQGVVGQIRFAPGVGRKLGCEDANLVASGPGFSTFVPGGIDGTDGGSLYWFHFLPLPAGTRSVSLTVFNARNCSLTPAFVHGLSGPYHFHYSFPGS